MAIASSAAPIIGAALDFGSSLGSGIFNINQARKNRAFQERMYYQQLQDNRANWMMMNQYDLPSAQVQRLRDANLNPLLMYSNGASGVTAANTLQSASAPSGAQASGDFRTNFGQAMLQAALVKAQIENINADTRQKDANSGLTQENTVNVALQNRLTRELWDVTKTIAFNERDLGFARIREIDNNIFQSSFMNAENAATLALNRLYLMKSYDLHAWELGEQFKIAWENVATGKIQANAAWKNSLANMMNAVTQRNFSNAQIGYLGTQSLLNRQLYNFNEKANKISLKMMKKQYEGLKLTNAKFRNELTLQQQQQVTNYLDQYYKYMNNSYYRQYGVNELPTSQSKLMKEILPIGQQLNNTIPGSWMPDQGFDQLLNSFSVPLNLNY